MASLKRHHTTSEWFYALLSQWNPSCISKIKLAGFQLAARELFRDWLRARFTELGRVADADKLALYLLGRAQGIAVIAHVYQDTALLQREIQQLDNWISQL